MWVREAWERAAGDRPSRPNPEGANSARSSYRLLDNVKNCTFSHFHPYLLYYNNSLRTYASA